MKKKKTALIVCAVAVQAILLVFWAMLIIETVCPIYRLSASMAIVGRDITVYAPVRCRTDFADIQNKKECGGNRQWQNHYLRNWAANTKGKGII